MARRLSRLTVPADPHLQRELMDTLEPRQLLTTFTVSTTADSGTGSLRNMIAQANISLGVDVIEFSPSMAGETIRLTSGEIPITDALSIRGVDSEGNRLGIYLSANASSRHFTISDATSADIAVSISDLWLLDGYTLGNGGAIYNKENLTLDRVALTSSRAGSTSSQGGAIGNAGDLTIRNSYIAGNRSSGDAGAIVSFGRSESAGGANLTIINSTIASNSARGAGGGILQQGYGQSANLVIRNSTLAYNGADSDATGGDDRGGALILLSTGTWLLESTIVAGNTQANVYPDEIGLGDNLATLLTARNNLIQNVFSSGGITDGTDGNIVGHDAMLSDDAVFAGGPYQTFPLLAGSPAIDAGRNPTGLGTDQRGEGFRRVDGQAIDIGAFEAQQLSLVVNTANDGEVVYGDEMLTLREAILYTNNNPGADTITFDTALSGSTIVLHGRQLDIMGALELTGLGADNLAIDGDGGSPVFSIDDYVFGSRASVSITDLTIQNGYQSDAAGILTRQNLTLTGVTLRNNHATGFGGAVYATESDSANPPTLTLINTTITGNTAGQYAGGIYSDVPVVIRNSRITGNEAGRGGGGGIYVTDAGSLNIVDSEISGNSASGDGGGIRSSAPVMLSRSVVANNVAGDDAGGIFLGGNSSHTIANSTISENTSSDYGGGIWIVSGSLLLTGSTVSGNTAPIGGGINIASGVTATITNSTISGNTASQRGGGVYAAGRIEITNTTIAYNTDEATPGGGLYVAGDTTTIHSTIVSDNLGWSGSSQIPGDIYLLFGSVSGDSSHNLIGDADTAGGLTGGSNNNIVGIDAGLAPLAYNGGSTMTHALETGSPAIDAGFNPGSLTTDQRSGVFRRLAGGTPDIGAYERQVLSLVVDNAGDEDDGNTSAGQLTLREAVAAANGNPFDDTISFDESLIGQRIELTNGVLRIEDDVEINGPGRDDLIISGGGTTRHFIVNDNDADNDIVVFISGLRLTNGYSSNNGGSITNDEALTLDSVRIDGNSAANDGGAIINRRILTIASSTLESNIAGDAGGAIDNDGETVLVITETTINNNIAGGAAGAIDNDQAGVLTITRSVFRNNSAGSDGGAIDNGGQFTVTGGEFAGNTATNAQDGRGGAIRNQSGGTLVMTRTTLLNNSGGIAGGAIENRGTATLTRATLDGNTASGAGGAIDNAGGVLAIYNSTLSNNTAGGSGGAIWTDTELLIQNSTISGNRAGDYGGGICMFDGTVFIANSTVAFNTADADNDGVGQGGAIDVGKRDGAGTLATISTIYANNVLGTASPSDNDITLTNGSVSGNNNLVTDPATSGGMTNGSNANIVGVDPKLGVLANNGGPTLTHAIYPGSPARDAGFALAGVVQDQRGVGRIHGTNADIGAFEWVVAGEFSLEVMDGSRAQSTAIGNDTHVTVIRNTDSDLVAFIGSGSNWSALRLRDYTGAPAVTGDPVVWTDPNDGMVYIAAPSAAGFILHRRATDGTWSFRNLSDEASVSNADSPQGVLVFFVSRPKTGSPLVTVAGITGSGEIVAFQQNSAATANSPAAWAFYNITDDLNSQSMTTPAFTQMTSYVTSWNQWTLAGLDASGNVQGVWVNIATFTTWRVDNLSAITGADPLVGELDVTLTTWGGIRFSGADENGHLVATWWNPSLGGGNWRQTDLTTQVATGTGPTLSGGRLTAWFATGNRISYAGFTGSGDVLSYYWQPSDGATWNADNLTEFVSDLSARPTGAITAYVSAAGTVSIVAADSNHNLVRLWSPTGAEDTFSLDNLTDFAVRV